MIKCIITDLDGTLFYKHGKTHFDLSKENEASLALMKEYNIPLYIASGRAPIYTHAILDKYGFSDHKIAAFNGAILEDNDKRINTYLLDKKDINIIYNFLLNYEKDISCMQLMSVDAQRIFHNLQSHEIERYKKYHRQLGLGSINKQEIKDYLISNEELEIAKVMLNFENEEITKEIYNILIEKLYPEYFVAQSFDTFIEICNPKASKGNLVNYLMDQYNYLAKDIVVIGDSLNDMGMYIGEVNKFAMNSGDDLLKEKADHVVDDFSKCVNYYLK